jgi:hypothetical protein
MLRDELAGRVILCSHCGAPIRVQTQATPEPARPSRRQPDWLLRRFVIGCGIAAAVLLVFLILWFAWSFWVDMGRPVQPSQQKEAP